MQGEKIIEADSESLDLNQILETIKEAHTLGRLAAVGICYTVDVGMEAGGPGGESVQAKADREARETLITRSCFFSGSQITSLHLLGMARMLAMNVESTMSHQNLQRNRDVRGGV